jgi:hypothetical protein
MQSKGRKEDDEEERDWIPLSRTMLFGKVLVSMQYRYISGFER